MGKITQAGRYRRFDTLRYAEVGELTICQHSLARAWAGRWQLVRLITYLSQLNGRLGQMVAAVPTSNFMAGVIVAAPGHSFITDIAFRCIENQVVCDAYLMASFANPPNADPATGAWRLVKSSRARRRRQIRQVLQSR